MKLNYEIPEAYEYIELRDAAGLSIRKLAHAAIGLSNSLFSVVIRSDEGKLVGMGRIIGDGGCHYQVVDIAVHPVHQGIGLGKKIMQHIQHYITQEVDEDSYVSLIADQPADKLYRQFNFIPVAPRSIGMCYSQGNLKEDRQ